MRHVVIFALVAVVVGCKHDDATAPTPPVTCDTGWEAREQGCVPTAEACGETAIPKSGAGCEPVGVPAGGCGAGFAEKSQGCEPILPSAPCAPGTMAVPGDSACVAIGVAKCASGFDADGAGGCRAVLPKDMCPPGKMAVPGESTCRDIAPCGTGRFGDLPLDSSTLYVDGSYSAGGSDGSIAKPFTTVQAAIDAAGSSGTTTIAIAAGSYVENLDVNKPVRLLGRCPSMVELKGKDTLKVPTVMATKPSEVRRLAITGWVAAEVKDSELTISETWVHDLIGVGVHALTETATAKLTISKSLVERAHLFGIYPVGAIVTIEDSVIRDTQPRASDNTAGRGIEAEDLDATHRTTLTVRRSLVERNHQIGIYLGGSIGIIDATVVRDTLTQVSDDRFGRGIAAELDPVGKIPSELTLTSSVVERNKTSGIYISGSKATIDATTVRDTLAQPWKTPTDLAGRGIEAVPEDKTGLGSDLTITGSLVENSIDVGVFVFGSKGDVKRTIVRATKPPPGLDFYGRGVELVNGELSLERVLVEKSTDVGVLVKDGKAVAKSIVVRETSTLGSGSTHGYGIVVQGSDSDDCTLTLTGSLVERHESTGLQVVGATANLEATIIRDVVPQLSDSRFGRGIGVELNVGRKRRGKLSFSKSIVERVAEVGIVTIGSDATVTNSVVRNVATRADGRVGNGVVAQADGPTATQATLTLKSSLVEAVATSGITIIGATGTADHVLVRGVVPDGGGLFGDGISVQALMTPVEGLGRASLTIGDSLVVRSKRAGIAVFGADLVLSTTSALCNPFDLDAEPLRGPPNLTDSGGSFCGCTGVLGACKAASASLAPIPSF